MVRGYIFDWDGTLSNTIGLTYDIYRQVFREMGKGTLSRRKFNAFFGRNHLELYNKLGLTPSERRVADERWLDAYRKRQNEISLYPHARELLEHLKKNGFKTALVSSGKTWRIAEELDLLGIGHLFDCVVTAEHTTALKPAPDGILAATKKLGVVPADCIYVGDMAEDVAAGKRAGMKTAVVTHGLQTKRELAKAKPDFFLKSLNPPLGTTRAPKPLQLLRKLLSPQRRG